MDKKITINVKRNDKKTTPSEKTTALMSDEQNRVEVVTANEALSEEEQYVKVFEPVVEGYMTFTQTYKAVSKQLMNPFKMKKNAGRIYQELETIGKTFNAVIATFKAEAVPPEDLKAIHQDILTALNHFEVYNNEFPTLMMSGNFKRIREVSKGMDEGHKGLKHVFEALEERENQKQA